MFQNNLQIYLISVFHQVSFHHCSKKVKVVPVDEKDSKLDCHNYCPISL